VARNQQDSAVTWDAVTTWDVVDGDRGGPLLTLETTEAAVRKAVDGITRDGHLTDKPQVIRIERAG
jgi:homoserine dehydrogenase